MVVTNQRDAYLSSPEPPRKAGGTGVEALERKV